MRRGNQILFAIYKNSRHKGNIYGLTKHYAIMEYLLSSYSTQIEGITTAEILEIEDLKNFSAIQAISKIHYFKSKYLNGLALSPTYDKLFDQGYITFTDKGELLCGTQLSSYTWEKLNINPNSKKKMRIYPENREKYLDYHRKYVFQDNIDDLIIGEEQ